MIRLLIILSILASCKHLPHKERVTQCLSEYRVVYENNNVPDWDTPPEGFCSETNDLAVPLGTSLFPLEFRGKVAKTSASLKHHRHWFYVIWGCYKECPIKK